MRKQERMKLLRWARHQGRDFPWRKETDSYKLAVTEQMLIRTRADQVAKHWNMFFYSYPTVDDLARANELNLSKVLSPLGLCWRQEKIRGFARAATVKPEWLRTKSCLPGIGPYVRAAVIGVKGEGLLPVDTTIARVLSRYHGIKPTSELRRNRRIHEAVATLGKVSRKFFHAALDHASLVCTPAAPKCPECPLAEGCSYFNRKKKRHQST